MFFLLTLSIRIHLFRAPAGATLLIAAVFLTACETTPPEVVVLTPDQEPGKDGTYPVSFVSDIRPILEDNCISCHYSGNKATEVSFESWESVLESQGRKFLVLPGFPERSPLFLVTVLPGHFSQAMPPAQHSLSESEIWVIYQWILQGAEWPEGEEGTLKRKPETVPEKPETQITIPPDVI